MKNPLVLSVLAVVAWTSGASLLAQIPMPAQLRVLNGEGQLISAENGTVLSERVVIFPRPAAQDAAALEVEVGGEVRTILSVGEDFQSELLIVTVESIPSASEVSFAGFQPSGTSLRIVQQGQVTGEVELRDSISRIATMAVLKLAPSDSAWPGRATPLLNSEGKIAALTLIAESDDSWLALPSAYLQRLTQAGVSPYSPRPDEKADAEALRLYWRGACDDLSRRFNRASLRVRFLGGSCLAEKGDHQGAVREFGEVLREDPRNPSMLSALALLFQSIENFERARQLAESSESLLSGSADASLVLGTSALIKGEPEDALNHYQRARAQAASASRLRFAWFGSGNALLEMGRFSESLLAYQMALDLPAADPRHSWENILMSAKPMEATLHVGRAKALLRLDRWQESLQSFDKALQLLPALENSDNLVSMGEAHSRLGQWEQALELFRKAAGLDPQSNAANHWHGVAASWKGAWDEAITAFEKAVQLNPQEPETRYLLGIALLRKDRVADARVQLEALQRLNPEMAGQLALQINR